MKIADIHAHIFPDKLAEKASHSIGDFYGVSIEREANMHCLTAEDRLAGVTRCVVSNSATSAKQVFNANTFLAEAVRGHAGYLAFGTIYPGMDGYEEELDRMLELGLRGIKIHPDFQKLAIDDESAIDTYKAIARRGLPVLFHMGDNRYDFSSPERLTNLLRRVPDLQGRGRAFRRLEHLAAVAGPSAAGKRAVRHVLHARHDRPGHRPAPHRQDRPRPADLRHGFPDVEPEGGACALSLPRPGRELPAEDPV